MKTTSFFGTLVVWIADFRNVLIASAFYTNGLSGPLCKNLEVSLAGANDFCQLPANTTLDTYDPKPPLEMAVPVPGPVPGYAHVSLVTSVENKSAGAYAKAEWEQAEKVAQFLSEDDADAVFVYSARFMLPNRSL